MKYPYFRGLEADRYSFYRVPKALIKVDLFEKMSGDAKLLYAVLLDRMNLSLKNGWQDEDGNAYMQSADVKKLILLNFPYIIAFYMVEKAAWLYRHCNGDTIVDRLMVLFMNFGLAYKSYLPSFHPFDLMVGLIGAVALKAVIYFKGKNAKKYRQGEEYGSARWGNAKDIEPFIDPVFENNVLLTQTERLMMSGRPKHPKYARNKNVIVIGGSGSGKTRFFVKPNLMQMPEKVSYVCTDPKGYNIPR